MDRRAFLALLTLPVLAELFAGCGSDDDGAAAPDRAHLSGNATRVTTGADPAAAALANNLFAADLYERLMAKDPSANLVFSPTSIAIALAMTSGGAKGATLTEIDAVLHVSDPAGIHRSMNGLTAALEAADKTHDNSAEGGEGVSAVQLNVANSLWGQIGLRFEQVFLDLLSAEYGAGMELVDYEKDPEAARVAINQWVADRTNDRIPELLAEGSLTRDARLTLVNAIYLKADWLQTFPEDATDPGPFMLADGSTKQVDFMHRTGSMRYADGQGWQAFDLPYVFEDLSFTVAVGDDAAVVVPAGDDVFAALTDATEVRLSMPKFDTASSVALGPVLREMGMTTAFTDAADLSGMTTEVPLQVFDVVHQANITVNENGTEAAAATAVIAGATALPPEPIDVVVDRPFTFWIRERSTNAIVFMGRVNDPSR